MRIYVYKTVHNLTSDVHFTLCAHIGNIQHFVHTGMVDFLHSQLQQGHFPISRILTLFTYAQVVHSFVHHFPISVYTISTATLFIPVLFIPLSVHTPW